MDSLFSSARERRLWGCTAAAMVGVFATLGLATTLADVVRHHGLITICFVLGMVLVAATILTQGLQARPRRAEIGVVLGIATVYYMVFLRMAIPERSHLIEYSVVAVFIYEALKERASQGRWVPVPALLAVIATSLVGVIDECIQLLIPSRHFDTDDILFNFLASVMAVGACVVMGWVRSWFGGSHRSKTE